MSDRIQLQLGVIGALHQCETAIALLNGASRSLAEHGRDGFAIAVSDALSTIWALQKAVDQLAEENERQRIAEFEAHLSKRVVNFPFHRALAQDGV